MKKLVLQKSLKFSTLVIAVFILTFLTSCSSVHLHKSLLFKSIEGFDRNPIVEKKLTRYPVAYHDQVTLNFIGAKLQLALFAKPTTGIDFVGPLFLPFFPLLWEDHTIESVVVEMDLISTVDSKMQISFDATTVSVDDRSPISPTPTELPQPAVSAGPSSRRLVFEFEKVNYPDQIKVILNGILLNGATTAPIIITFANQSYWHYVPFVFMHID